MKKYKLDKSNTKTTPNGSLLYAVVALKSFGIVNAGDVGGYIESEKNLSQEGDAWV